MGMDYSFSMYLLRGLSGPVDIMPDHPALLCVKDLIFSVRSEREFRIPIHYRWVKLTSPIRLEGLKPYLTTDQCTTLGVNTQQRVTGSS